MLSVGEHLYRLGLGGVRMAYQRQWLKIHRLPGAVVSVGNLTWGGTGKTPLVIFLAQALTRRGWKVAVLTRGYGQDETHLLTERLDPIPVLVGPDRVEMGNRALGVMGRNLLLLDDGYQQWRLKKDVDILTVDGRHPFGNGHLIPRGSLREPIAEAARADLIVVKRSGQEAPALQALEEQLRALHPKAGLFLMDCPPQGLWSWPSKKPVPLEQLRGERVCTVAGIAHPRQFEATVGSLGARFGMKIRVADHHPYTAGEWVRFLERCRRHRIRRVVTTAKDAVRIPPLLVEAVGRDFKGVEILVLEIGVRLEPSESEFLHRIDSLLAGQGR